MARYRRLPVEIEAVQFFSVVVDGEDRASGLFDFHGSDTPPAWLIEAQAKRPTEPGALFPIRLHDGSLVLGATTLEGQMRVSPGDYIIRGVEGEIYACKPHIFAKTYEAVQ